MEMMFNEYDKLKEIKNINKFIKIKPN